MLLLATLHLMLVLADGASFYHHMSSTRDDAWIFNAAGRLRGSMQRLAKLEALGENTDALRPVVEELLASFAGGRSGYVLGLDSEHFARRIAALAVEKLRARVAEERMDCGEDVTVSIGVTAYRPGDDLAALFSRADARLFEAKEAGRNLVRAD